jgi:DNA-3-methyladenine glycosylase
MKPVERTLLRGDAPAVAPLLLGKLLVHGACVGRIVEVEAYTADEPASHSFSGRTERNAVMFGPPGHLYCYRSYGIHVCANVVTGAEGDGQAVLIRALDAVEGIDVMRRRRGGGRPLADGPGKLWATMGSTRAAAITPGCSTTAHPRRPTRSSDHGSASRRRWTCRGGGDRGEALVADSPDVIASR